MTTSLIIEGNWFSAGTSAPVPARLKIDDVQGSFASLLLNSGETRQVEITSVSDRLGAVDRRIEMHGGDVFVTSDNDSVDQLGAASGGVFSKVFSLERFHPRLFIFLIAAVGLIYGLVVYGLPVAAKVAAWATPPQVVAFMDTSTLSTLDEVIFEESKLDESQKKSIEENFSEIKIASAYEGPLNLVFRDGGRMGANALALPGGTIVLTDQLANMGTDDEVTSVLAHEIAHVQHEHGLQQLYRAMGFAGMIALLAGDLGTVAEEVLSGGSLLIAMAASREMELEADDEAVDLLKKVNIDPNNLSTMLDKLYQSACGDNVEACEDSGWLSSHPGGKERRDALQRKITP